MNLENQLTIAAVEAVKELFSTDIEGNQIQFQKTRKEFEGDVTIVVFPLTRLARKSPEETGKIIGEYLKEKVTIVEEFNVVKGFLNLVITDSFWVKFLKEEASSPTFGIKKEGEGKTYMVEYSSPNTNKPLHLGHLRNNFLGYAVSNILKATGNKVIRTQVINDRGVHICKSMLAWQKFGNGETPESTGLKGDKLVGKYYVAFDKALNEEAEELTDKWNQGDLIRLNEEKKKQFTEWKEELEAADSEEKKKGLTGKIKELAKAETTIMAEVKEMLLKWESKDQEVYSLWETMNKWVYAGFDVTYASMGVDFDTLYYESDTYLLGKDVIEKGLASGVFIKKEDGSVWCDLTEDGLDEKLVLRSDGTAVYMTQDIGTAIERVKDYPDLSSMIYTVGNEQDYHFKVLFLILKKLGYKWAEGCFHLSYGMVDLPTGKMKSREGTVVDADDLISSVVNDAKEMANERGRLEEMSEEEKNTLFEMIGKGGLKYYLLRIDPKKRMMFDPAESIDLNGQTAPYIQYCHARISSLTTNAGELKSDFEQASIQLIPEEKEIIKLLSAYPGVLEEAAKNYSPALVANYAYDLTKQYNTFYQNVNPIVKEEDLELKSFRIELSKIVQQTLNKALKLLGIDSPQRM